MNPIAQLPLTTDGSCRAPGGGPRRVPEPGGPVLRLLADVRPEELGTAVLLAAAAFLLLCAYFLLKVAREPLIITGAGPEWKVYSYAVQLGLLVAVVRVYTFLCSRFGRIELITAVMTFFALCLGLFALLSGSGRSVGVAFYIWVGIFSLVTLAQFWALAADIYTREQGERLFAVLGVGASLGGVVGSYGARWLAAPLGVPGLMVAAILLLMAYLVMVRAVHARERRRHGESAAIAGAGTHVPRSDHDDPIGASATLELFGQDRYLLLVGVLTLVLNAVGTLGEYVLDRHLLLAAHQAVADRPASGLTVQTYIAAFRGTFFAWVNLLALLLQAFVVPRLIRRLGVGRLLLLVPIVALLGYATMALLPVITVIALAKLLENSGTHSVEKTGREALFLIASREEKYKAKTVVDTLFWRAGDVLAAGIVWLGSTRSATTSAFVAVNLVLVLIWLELTLIVTRLHRARIDGVSPAPVRDPVPAVVGLTRPWSTHP